MRTRESRAYSNTLPVLHAGALFGILFAMSSEKITMKDGKLAVPENPIIPYIEGDGTGPDITRAAMVVWNAAVEKAYGGKRRIEWKEVRSEEHTTELQSRI